MSVAKIESAVREFSPEPVVCWCNGQSLESRYSSSAAGGGAAGAAGAGIGRAILRRRLEKARPANAEPMPRFPVVAVSAGQIFLFDGPVAKKGPFATLQRDQVQVAHSGSPWHRLDLLASTGEGARTYTVMVFGGPGGGLKRLKEVVEELSRDGG
jgi:hypothetical protein